MGILRVGKIVLHVLAVLMLFGALALMLAAFFTPAWQQVDIGSGRTVSHHQHGLYQVCVSDVKQGSQATNLCTYMRYGKEKSIVQKGKSVNDDDDIHAGESWRFTAMILLAITLFLAIVALTFSLLGACFIWGSIVWAIFTVLSTATAIAGIAIFTVNARSEDHILVNVGTGQFEQRVGYSYYLGCGGTAAFAFASFLAVITASVHCCLRNNDSDSPSGRTYPAEQYAYQYQYPKNTAI